MKKARVGYILSSDEMDRLMRWSEWAKQEFVQKQMGGGFMSLGRIMLSVDRRTKPQVQPARLGMSSEQALKATFLGKTENVGALALLKATQKLLDDHYAGKQLPEDVTVNCL